MTVSTPLARPAAGPEASVGFANLPRTQVIGTLIGLGLALLLSALDQTIVGTALPRIVAELQGFEHYAGVTTAYLLASTAVVPIVGKLSDLYGRKLFFLGGVLLFLAASLLCGLAQDMPQLIAFRGLQGLGAGVISVMVFTVVGDLFPPARRGRIQGVFGAIFGLASVVGPLLGGYLTDQLSWRWVFLVNLPVGLLALAALVVLFPNVRPPRREHAIDYRGAVCLVLALVPLMLALSLGGHQYGWDSAPIVGLVLFGLVMGALFVWQERRAAEPVIPLSLFGNSIVSISLASSTLIFMGMFGTILFIPLFIQAVIGASATTSGTILMPMTGGMIVGSTLAGQLVSRTGKYRLVALAGVGLTTIGMLLLTRLDPASTYLDAIRDTVVMGLGLGATMPIFTLVVQNAVPYAQLGTATAVTQLSRSIGGMLGAAVFGSLLVNRFGPAFGGSLGPAAAEVPPDLLAQLGNPQALLNPLAFEQLAARFAQLGPHGPALLEQVLAAIRQALALALHDVFLVGGVLVGLAFVLLCFLREVPLRRSHAVTRSDGAAPPH
jgi:EmrB/QacA subfamily drug resistance transporter